MQQQSMYGGGRRQGGGIGKLTLPSISRLLSIAALLHSLLLFLYLWNFAEAQNSIGAGGGAAMGLGAGMLVSRA